LRGQAGAGLRHFSNSSPGQDEAVIVQRTKQNCNAKSDLGSGYNPAFSKLY
jgi:hypothetical protein